MRDQFHHDVNCGICLFVDADNIQSPASVDDYGLLESLFIFGIVNRVTIAGNGDSKWADNWGAFLSRFPDIEVTKFAVESLPQAADAALLCTLSELQNDGSAILVLTKDALLKATFERICNIRGRRMIKHDHTPVGPPRAYNALHQKHDCLEAAKTAVTAWVSAHPKAKSITLTAITSIAKRTKLDIKALAQAAAEMGIKMDNHAEKFLEQE